MALVFAVATKIESISSTYATSILTEDLVLE